MRSARLLAATFATAAGLAAGAAPASAASAPPWYQLITDINHVRATHGVRPVVLSLGLSDTARGHSIDMMWRGYFGHTSPAGSTFVGRIMRSSWVRFGAWSAGETLAWGVGSSGDPAAVVQGWLASPEHRAVMLSPTYGMIGIGRVTGDFMHHDDAAVWTVDWGHR